MIFPAYYSIYSNDKLQKLEKELKIEQVKNKLIEQRVHSIQNKTDSLHI